MMKPVPRNLITDVDGLVVGNAEDEAVRTGVTVILPTEPAVMAVDVRGGAPGTRDTEALSPGSLVDRFHGLVLSGGSVFGLDAASAVTHWLSRRGRGLPLGPVAIPVVPSAILFDLANGGDKGWQDNPPYRELALKACRNSSRCIELGNSGAGFGATAGPIKGGLGSASLQDETGIVVGALFAVNSYGSTVIPGTDTFWAWTLEQGRELGGQKAPGLSGLAGGLPLDRDLPEQSQLAQNTTIGVIATNVALTKTMAQRVAVMAQDGLARAIRPVHTPFDGDTVFVISTAARQLDRPESVHIARLGMMAADCAARAIARGVFRARSLGDIASYRDLHGAALTG
ncbi:MAG: P1 family peptidase [Sphingomonadales bacterium]